MSVLIKGMKMPKKCWECPCFVDELHVCNLDTECRDVYDNKPDWCPLVELPGKHGRLFDTDEVVKCLEELEPDCKEKAWAIGLVEWAIAKRWCVEAEGAEK